MSTEYINQLNREAARRAAREGLYPYTPEDEDLCSIADFTSTFCKALPNLGNYIPAGWRKDENELFVDSSGFGSESEPALTLRSLRNKVKELKATDSSVGFALVDCGQFQVYIGVYHRDPKKQRASRKQQRHIISV
jgi:hypothetical protein